MFKKIAKPQGFLISYRVHQDKIIEVLFSAKEGRLVGWCQRVLFDSEVQEAKINSFAKA
jgi:hypothetical protein